MKLYKATASIDVVFVSDKPEREIIGEAQDFLVEETGNYPLWAKSPRIEEVTQMSQVPEAWLNALVYGVKEDLRPAQILEIINKKPSEEKLQKIRERIVELETELKELKEKVG